MKILHLATNDQFINTAYSLFEAQAPAQNEVWIYQWPGQGDIFKPRFKPRFINFWDTVRPSVLKQLKDYDLVIIHALTTPWITMINHAPKGVRFIWLGFGFDYQDYIYADPAQILLPETAALMMKLGKKSSGVTIKNAPKAFARRLLKSNDRKAALKKISGFNTVLRAEYDIIQQKGLLGALPPFVPFNYGNLEETLVKHVIGQRVGGGNILLRNSADIKNNHSDGFTMLAGVLGARDVKVLCPLSYGDMIGAKQNLLQAGEAALGKKFHPLMDFMDLEKYLLGLKSCGFVVMNHVRQQGLGTTVQMMYMGAKIFLREECLTYTFFKDQGAYIFSVQDLEKNPALLDERLGNDETVHNIKILERHWSQAVIERKVRKIIDSGACPC